ncbi:ribonuclease HI [Agromyces sp. H3Y2-19a]|jgi:ribonuclease HI|uniref:RNase H family protein n=1 Tax=Agromyces TaxID=33877 RepID=UPI0023BA04BF|nr:RNase H family protein [Agromyces chromiiresistens]MDF0512900.1 ribonuclease HI [Agromyces chromiiresistens]
MIIAAADGSALGNPGPAGWAWYVADDCWAAGGWKHSTNNVGELTAVLELFRATAHLDDELLVQCDSQYVINSVTKWMPGWKRKGWRKADGKPVMNVEILKEIDAAIAGRRYRFEWVKGHVGHPMNEAADERARAAAEAFRSGLPVPAGPGWSGACESDAAVATAVVEGLPAAGADDGSVVPARADASAAVETAPHDDRSPADATLFDFDDPTADWLTMTLDLTVDEHSRLVERARAAGTSPEEFLRGLI